MKKIAISALLFLSSKAIASPSDFQKQVTELNAIFGSRHFRDALINSPHTQISSMVKNGSVYTFTTSQCAVDVKVQKITVPPPEGPLAISVIVGKPICLPK